MEVCRLKEPLLRSRGFPLFAFLAPSFTFVYRPISPVKLSQYRSGQIRGFSPAALHNAEDSQSKAASEKSEKLKSNISNIINPAIDSRPMSRLASGIPQRTNMRPEIDAKFDELFPSKRKQLSPASALGAPDAFRASASLDRQGRRPGSIAGSMLMPGASHNSGRTERQVAAGLVSGSGSAARRNKRTVRSRPAVGRTIEVEEKLGVDFGHAIKKLALMMSVNQVRSDLKKQKFHERAGVKRKKLKSSRWRKYFKAGFKATIERVKKMRRQGW